MARSILGILNDEFGLAGAQLIDTHPQSPENDRYSDPPKKSVVVGHYPVGEVRLDMGAIPFAEFNRDALYFVAHPYNDAVGVQPETVLKQMRLFGTNLLDHDADFKLLCAVLPIGPYDLNHSVKRQGRAGFLEGNGLKMHLDDLARAGFREVIAIGSHSPTTKEIARNLGINYREVDPFRADAQVSSPTMGPLLYTSPENNTFVPNYEDQMKRLTPFITYLKEKIESLDDVYFVATDDGSVDVTEQITQACRGNKQNMIGIIKGRDGPGKSKVYGVKSWSTANLEEIRGKTCVIADDRRLSGNTLNDVAASLKEDYGVGRVVALCAHDMSYDEGIRNHTSVDEFVFLETNPNSPVAQIKDDPRIHRMSVDTTGLLLGAEVFDSYVTLRDNGAVGKVR